MFDKDNIDKAKDLLWSYCMKCTFHGDEGCKREEGTCEIDEAWEYLDAAEIND